MSAPYPFNRIPPPNPEACGNWQPLPLRPSFNQPLISETVLNWGFPSNFENPPWNNGNSGLHDYEMRCRLLPAWPGIRFDRGRFPGSLNVECRTGTSTEMKVCRQFQRRGKCAYGDQCRFLHDFGSLSLNYEARTVASGHVADRRSGIGQLKEVGSKVQTNIIACGELPMPGSCKTRPCFTWQTTGHCPYGEGCRFAHGESELQKLESCSASEHGNVAGASTTTSAAVAARSMGSREIETDCKNTGPRLNQFLKSKELKKLIGIYADWLDN